MPCAAPTDTITITTATPMQHRVLREALLSHRQLDAGLLEDDEPRTRDAETIAELAALDRMLEQLETGGSCEATVSLASDAYETLRDVVRGELLVEGFEHTAAELHDVTTAAVPLIGQLVSAHEALGYHR
jgi:hypothetical protein